MDIMMIMDTEMKDMDMEMLNDYSNLSNSNDDDNNLNNGNFDNLVVDLRNLINNNAIILNDQYKLKSNYVKSFERLKTRIVG
jgi:hypothetical protein